jgi:hypothetical protein
MLLTHASDTYTYHCKGKNVSPDAAYKRAL